MKDVTSREDARYTGESLSPQLDDGSPPLHKMAMSEMTTYRWTFPEDVIAYREGGVDAIGVWRPKLSQFGDERGIELVRESGLSVSSLSWAGGFTGSNGHSFRECVDDAHDAINVAGALGADCLVIISGARAGHTNNHARRLLIDGLDLLADSAAAHGVALAIQPVHPQLADEWSFLTTLDDTLDVIDRCKHDCVRLAFDVYHLWQEPRLIERIPEFASLVSLVQLSDWREPTRSEHDRCLPGDGDIPLGDVVSAFDDSQYDGYFEFEIWSEELWKSDYDLVIQSCRSRFDALFKRQRSIRESPPL